MSSHGRAWPAKRAPDIVEFVTDPQLLGLPLSPAQVTLLRSISGLPLRSKEQLDLYRQCTGREAYASHPFPDVAVLAGARAGKDSRIAASVVCYEALFGGHERQPLRPSPRTPSRPAGGFSRRCAA